jgi:NAD(P)-dependent dehydrogenase (short-subunit alcohol dehydrogenase family)
MACRNPDKGQEALATVQTKATAADPELVSLDLADQSSIEQCAAHVAGMVDKLDTLMNNAGVMAIPLRRTTEGWEMQFATNHLGHFALTGRLLSTLLRADAPRVVTTSSTGHRMGSIRWNDPQWERRYSPWRAYGQTKLANLLFTFELARRARAAGTPLIAAAAHPGYAATHLQAVGPEMSGNRIVAWGSDWANRLIAQPDDMGALPQLYAATAPDVQSGEYFGPDGPFEQRGYPKRVRAKRTAYDVDDARRLWEVSEALTGVTYQWPAAS